MHTWVRRSTNPSNAHRQCRKQHQAPRPEASKHKVQWNSESSPDKMFDVCRIETTHETPVFRLTCPKYVGQRRSTFQSILQENNNASSKNGPERMLHTRACPPLSE